MNDAELNELWKKGAAVSPAPAIPSIDELQSLRWKNRFIINHRDRRELLMALFVGAVFAWYGWHDQVPMKRLGDWIIVAGAGLIMLVILASRLFQRHQVEGSLAASLKNEIHNLNIQIALLRNVFWWYLLPLGGGLIVKILAYTSKTQMWIFLGIVLW